MSILAPFLVSNKAGLKFAFKISLSMWGAVIIAMVLDFEHPIWAMITGMITFFAPDHGQVLKKGIFQSISTILGGVTGLILMANLAQSPLLAALSMAAIVFTSSAFAFHTRDANVTMRWAIFALTVSLMIIVPVATSPTPEIIVGIFIDRAGTVLVGVAWACFVSAALWPIFSSDVLSKSVSKLVGLTLEAEISVHSLHDRLQAIYGCVLEVEDAARHAEYEGYSGKRSAGIARELNKLAIEIEGEREVLRTIMRTENVIEPSELLGLSHLSELSAEHRATGGRNTIDRLNELAQEIDTKLQSTCWSESDLSARQRLVHVHRLTILICRLVTLDLAARGLADIPSGVQLRGTIISRDLQLANCLRTGLRSAILYLCAFFLWQTTAWGYGFLILVVPLIISITLSKVPHPEIVAKKVAIGAAIALVPGLFVYILLAQAPSAIEILVVVAGLPLFISLMGMTSMVTFAYSLGFWISYIVVLLPQNVQSTDVIFALDRSVAFVVGSAMLSILFTLIPRRRVLAAGGSVAALFEPDLRRALFNPPASRKSLRTADERIGLLIDKMLHVIQQDGPEERGAVIEKGAQAIFIMMQLSRFEELLRLHKGRPPGRLDVSDWKSEIYANFVNGQNRSDHFLAEIWGGSKTSVAAIEAVRLDRLIRATFQPDVKMAA